MRFMQATGDNAKSIIGRLATMSSKYGTKIECEGEIGVVKLKN